jgi:murE/murF fusion protein
MLIGQYFKNIDLKFKKHYFSGLSFNSKLCKKNNIFFAISGTNINGSKFINDALKNGACTIVSNNKFQGFKKNILYLRVKNVRRSLAETAYKIYNNKPKNLIAVTGTNGKSSIANFYFQILKLNNKKVASIGTLGIQTNKRNISVFNTTLDPVQLSFYLKKLKEKKIDNVILEASSHGLKQNRLDGLEFTTGIFTNLSHDHLDYHKSLNDYFKSKLYLFNKLLRKKSKIITDNSLNEFKTIKKISKKRNLNLKTILNNKSSIKLISHKYFGEKQFIKIRYNKIFYSFFLNLIGKIQIKNLLMSMLAAENKNLKFKNIVSKINKIKPVNGRMEKIGKIKNNSIVVLDYSHTPDALKVCLKNLKEQFKERRILIVFGCGGNRDKFKRPIMGKIANKYCNQIYLTDDNPRNENPKEIRKEIKKKINKSKLYEISKREKAIEMAIKNLKTGDILLVAGKGHENIQDYGSSRRFFSDRKIILQSIKKKNKNLFKNIKLNILKEENNSKDISKKININQASINSKEIKKNNIFFAIKGKKKDGNFYVDQAFKNGASLAVVNKFEKSIKKNKQIKVENTLKFLIKISRILRKNFDGKVIAITGSCGKTSLKELLGKTLNKFSSATFSPKSFNNKYGVPLSLFNINLNHKKGVFEIGMDKKGEIDFLSKIINPDIGVITNISYAHAKNFKNINQIANAKAEIINNIRCGGSLVLNADDKFFNFFKKIAIKKNLKIVSFSITKKGDVSLNYIKKVSKGFKISININKEKKYFFINFDYENYVKNLLALITIVYILGKIKDLKPNIFFDNKIPEGRGDISMIKIKNKKIFIIDESYNSNPLSLKSAINNFNSIKIKSQRKHLILGDMLELGKHSKKLHSEISKDINYSSIGKISVFGKAVKKTFKEISSEKKGLILRKTSQIFDLIVNNLNNNDYLMIKGSNSTGLNNFVKILKRKKINVI